MSHIYNDYGRIFRKVCEKYKNTYLIVAENGVLITVARSYRATIH